MLRKKESSDGGVAVITAISIVIMMIGGLFGYYAGRNSERDRAVRAGAAEWQTDGVKTNFVYRPKRN